MYFFFLLFSYFEIYSSKNLVFPFKKLTIEYLNKTKTINDFIYFNIYTNITMGTPPNKVIHFIGKSIKLFSYERINLQYTYIDEIIELQKEIENNFYNYYNYKNSSSHQIEFKYSHIHSDIYHLYNLQNEEIIKRLNYNIYTFETEYLCGNINVQKEYYPYDEYNIYFFKVIKQNNLIDDYYYTFIYEDNNIYFNQDYNCLLGKLIIGESPHQFNPEKYQSNEQIIINGELQLYINEIKLKSPK